MYYREKTTDFYGKKGCSWNGSMIYTIFQYTDDEDDTLEMYISYIDHISSGDSKQDHIAVLCYFEATCMKINHDFPLIHQLYVQTDNEKCYKKSELILGLFLISKQHKLEIISYIHTGIQDGKGPIDGHFATSMKHVSKYCNMGNNVVTPVDIVNSLRANGGVTNCVEEMVTINRNKTEEFINKYSNVISRLESTK